MYSRYSVTDQSSTPVPYCGIFGAFLFWATTLPVRFAVEHYKFDEKEEYDLPVTVICVDLFSVTIGIFVAVCAETFLHKYELMIINVILSSFCVFTLLVAFSISDAGKKWFYITVIFFVFVNISNPLIFSFLFDLLHSTENLSKVRKYLFGIALMRDTAVVFHAFLLFPLTYLIEDYAKQIFMGIIAALALIKISYFYFMRKQAEAHRKQFIMKSSREQCVNCLQSFKVCVSSAELEEEETEEEKEPKHHRFKSKTSVTERAVSKKKIFDEQKRIFRLAILFIPNLSNNFMYFLIVATWVPQMMNTNLNIPDAEFLPFLMYSVLVLISVPLFELIVRPLTMKCARHLNDYQWFGMGMFCIGFCLVVATLAQKQHENRQDIRPSPHSGQLRFYSNLDAQFNITFDSMNFKIAPFGKLFVLKVYGKGFFYKSADIYNEKYDVHETIELVCQAGKSITYIVNSYGVQQINQYDPMDSLVNNMASFEIINGIESDQNQKLYIWLRSNDPFENCEMILVTPPIEAQNYAHKPGQYKVNLLIEENDDLHLVAILKNVNLDVRSLTTIFIYNDKDKFGLKQFLLIPHYEPGLGSIAAEMVLLVLYFTFASVSYLMIVYKECPPNGRATLFSILNFYNYIGQAITLWRDVAYYIAAGESTMLIAFITVHGVCFFYYIYLSHVYKPVKRHNERH